VADRNRASDAERTARAEAAKAAAINDFLTNDLLVQALPWKNAMSDRLTLRELVDRAADRIGSRFRTRPLLEAAVRCTIGQTYQGLGLWDKSQSQFAAALEIYQREKGSWAVETAKTQLGLGSVLSSKDDSSRAEPLLRQATESLCRALGEGNPYTLAAMTKLAYSYANQGKMAEAEVLYVRALEVARTALGADAEFAAAFQREEHQTLNTMAHLAEFYLRQGKLSQAEPLAHEALELSRRIWGNDTFNTFWPLELMGQIYWEQGKLPEAERALVKVLEVCRRFRGEEHDPTLYALRNLARLYIQQGKLHEAEQALRQGLRSTNIQPSAILGFPEIYGELAAAFEQGGGAKEAEAAYREAVALRERLLAMVSDKPESQNEMAWYLATCPVPQLRDPARAVELARKATEKQAVASNWNTLGVSLYRTGDWKAAIEALEKSEVLAPNKNLAFNGLFLAMAHWQLGRRDEARLWYDRAVQWMDKHVANHGELRRFRAEAAAVLGLPEPAAPAKKEVPRPSHR
jgi:tetratricopeptide (TPR) repeat protein